MLKRLLQVAAAAFFVACAPALAQWQVPSGDVPIGRGAGATGFTSKAGAGVLFNTLHTATANYTLAASDCSATVELGTGSTGFFAATVPAVTGFAATCAMVVTNSDSGRGKAISGLSGIPFLWPKQSMILAIINGAWRAVVPPGLWQLTADTTWYVDPVNGNNNNDCLAPTTGACATIAIAMANRVCQAIDANFFRPIIQLADNTANYTTQVNACEVRGTQQPGGFTASVPTLRGNTTTPANVRITTTSSNGFSSVINNTLWRVEGIEFRIVTGGTAIVADVDSKIYLGKNIYTVTAGGNVFQFINGGFIELVDDFTISGPANVVIYGNHGGRMVSQPITVTISGTPAWAFAFSYMTSNSAANIPGVTFSGSATGNRCNISQAAGIDTNGGGASYLPGNVACTGGFIANPGWYN